MNKDFVNRVLICSQLFVLGISELEINKRFNFQEMEKAKRTIKEIEKK